MDMMEGVVEIRGKGMVGEEGIPTKVVVKRRIFIEQNTNDIPFNPFVALNSIPSIQFTRNILRLRLILGKFGGKKS